MNSVNAMAAGTLGSPVPSLIQEIMMTSSNGNIFRVTGSLCGEFTGTGEFPAQRPVTRSLDVFFDVGLNKWLSKQPWGWRFETPSWSLWRHRNSNYIFIFPRNNSTHNIDTFLEWQSTVTFSHYVKQMLEPDLHLTCGHPQIWLSLPSGNPTYWKY